MTKENLIKELGKRLDITQKDVAVIVDEFIKIFNETILKGEAFKIPGLFTVKLRAFKPFRWRDPKTGELKQGKPYYKVVFNLSEKVQDKIDRKEVDPLDLEDIGIDPLDYEQNKFEVRKVD